MKYASPTNGCQTKLHISCISNDWNHHNDQMLIMWWPVVSFLRPKFKTLTKKTRSISNGVTAN